ncbi:MAG: peptide chain release factor 2 [Candidatus Woesebacteria bacterium]|jgi:peptide chain release factor 2
MKNHKSRVEKLRKRFQKIVGSLKLDEKRNELKELEAKATDPKLWDDQERARGIMQEIGDLSKEIDEVEKLDEEITTLEEFSSFDDSKIDLDKEIKDVSRKIERLKIKSYLSDPYDKKNAILSIHAGQGGTEAMDWASMLYRMYLKFCENRGWETQTLDLTEGEEAGIKSVTIRVKGDYAYGYLKGEVGTHRLVRQSPFNADKLRQTSFALVEVLPEFADIDLPDIKINDDDLEWQFFRASSQGGQNVQKVSTAVRLKHKPTGIVVTAQTERYQEQNRKYALDHLRAKLWARKKAKREAKKKQLKGDYRPASWGNQIRSYVLHPYKMVKDLRTKVETSDTDAVLDGDIDKFIEAELKMEI